MAACFIASTSKVILGFGKRLAATEAFAAISQSRNLRG